jgi:hypothetical protein
LGVTFVNETTAAEIRTIASAMPEAGELWIGGAGSVGLDLSGLNRKAVRLDDFPTLETECLRWKN